MTDESDSAGVVERTRAAFERVVRLVPGDPLLNPRPPTPSSTRRRPPRPSLPADVRALYRLADGQVQYRHDDPRWAAGLVAGEPLLPLAEALLQWDQWAGFEGETGLDEFASSTPEGFVQPKYSARGWIPLTHDGGGNHVGVDLDPDVRGTVGRSSPFGRDDDQHRCWLRPCSLPRPARRPAGAGARRPGDDDGPWSLRVPTADVAALAVPRGGVGGGVDIVVEVGDWEHECCGPAYERGQVVDLTCMVVTTRDGTTSLVETGTSSASPGRSSTCAVEWSTSRWSWRRDPRSILRVPDGSALCGFSEDDGHLEDPWTGEVVLRTRNEFRVTVRVPARGCRARRRRTAPEKSRNARGHRNRGAWDPDGVPRSRRVPRARSLRARFAEDRGAFEMTRTGPSAATCPPGDRLLLTETLGGTAA